MLKLSRHSVFDVGAQTIANTVNTEGVMGAGLALEFKLRFPAMFKDYERRCEARQVRPGEPYVYAESTPQILNFPTKAHWRFPSRMEWIDRGLDAIRSHHAEWGIESLALPKLGSRNGGLDWDEVRGRIEAATRDLPVQVVLCMDEEPAPEGLEAAILARLNACSPEDLAKLGLRPSAAARVAAAIPFRRFRHVAELDGVGAKSYETIFQAFGKPRAGARQAKLDL